MLSALLNKPFVPPRVAGHDEREVDLGAVDPRSGRGLDLRHRHRQHLRVRHHHRCRGDAASPLQPADRDARLRRGRPVCVARGASRRQHADERVRESHVQILRSGSHPAVIELWVIDREREKEDRRDVIWW